MNINNILESLDSFKDWLKEMEEDTKNVDVPKEVDEIRLRSREKFKDIFKHSRTSLEEIESILDNEKALEGLDHYILGTFMPLYDIVGELGILLNSYQSFFAFFESFIDKIKALRAENKILLETIEELSKEK